MKFDKSIKLITCLGLFLFGSSTVMGQVTLLDEPFDGTSQFSTSTPLFNDDAASSGFDFFGIADGDSDGGEDFGVAGTVNYKAYTGFTDNFLTGMDMDGEGASLPITVTWSSINISGYNTLEFTSDFAEFFDTPGDIDQTDDQILVEYQIDGGGYQNLLAFEGADFDSGTDPFQNNGNFREDADFDGEGDPAGTQLTTAFQSFTKSIAGTGTSLDLRLTVSVNSGDEDFAADNFKITGVLAAPDTDAPIFQNSTPSASNITDEGIQLDVELDEAGTAYYVILADGAGAPSAAQVKAGNDASDASATNGNFVISGASPNSYNDVITGLTASTAYDIYAVAEDDEGSPNLQGTATLLEVTTTSSASKLSSVATAAGEPASISSLENDATITSTTDGAKVWDISLYDGNDTDDDSDTKPTIYTGLVIRQGVSNTVTDWSASIQNAALFQGTTKLGDATIGVDNLDFTGIISTSVADGAASTETVSLFISLNTSVTDGDIIQFSLAQVDVSTEGTATSSQVDPTLVTFESDATKNIIDVTATEFVASSESQVLSNVDFEVMVNAIDANGNLDKVARDISLSLTSGTGNLSSMTGLTAQAMVDGIFTWTDVRHNTVENIKLAIDDDGSVLTGTSETIKVLGNLFFTDYFDRTVATDLTASTNWSAHSGGGSNPIKVVGTVLSYTDYPDAGIGNAVEIVGASSSEDVSADIVEIKSGTAYFSTLVNVSSSAPPGTGDSYFLHTRQASGSFFTRVYAKDDGVGNLNFGISKGSGSAEYAVSSLNYDETYLIVFKYQFNTGTTDDDVVSLWINPAIGGSEPAADLIHSATQTDIAEIAQIALRQNSNGGTITANGIRASTTWTDLLPASCTAPSTQVSNVTFANTGNNSMDINWTQGDGDKTIVLVKEGSAVDAVPLTGVDYTVATSVFSDGIVEIGSGNIVVYTGDNTTGTVTVTGLDAGTTYHVAAFEYNAAGFCYNNTSSAINDNTTTTPVSINIVESITDFGSVDNGANSASQSFTIDGTGLLGNLFITTTAPFEISLDDAAYGISLELTETAGAVTTTTIYARFSPASGINGAINDNITINTTGTPDVMIALSGTEAGNTAPVVENFDICDNFQTWAPVSVIGDQVWDCTIFGNNDTNGIQMSGFSGGSQDNEDWLISRSFDLTATSSLSFWSRTAFDGLTMDVKVSSDYDGGGDPSTATWTDLVVTLPALLSDVWTETTGVDLSAFAGSGNYIAFVYYSNPTDGAARWTLDDIGIVNGSYTTPLASLTVVSSLTDFGSLDNGATSTAQTFTVAGDDLIADVVVTAPANFEVSKDGTNFSSEISYVLATDFTAPALSNQTVSIRFAANSGVNGVLGGDVKISTVDAPSENIAVSGTETGNTAILNDLFFSEYIEGTSSGGIINRAFEIFNGTGAAVDLSNYVVKQSHNGNGFDTDPDGAAPYALALSGTLADGDVYVVYNIDAVAGISDNGDLALTHGDTGGTRNTSFTGDDALGLFKSGVLIDLIGDPGNRPTDGWDVAGVTTATRDHTLVRKETISSGNITPLGSFGTSAGDSEWVVLDNDDFSNIGSHTFAPAEPGFTLTTDNFAGDFGDVAVGEVSTASSYTVSGTEITGDFTVTVPTGFEVSLTSDFSNQVGDSELPLSITPASGVIDNVTIFVRFAPDTEGAAAGDLVNAATGYASVNVAVEGTGTAEVTGLEELAKYSISVYPNPAEEVLNINIPASFGAGELKLVKLDGSVMLKAAIGAVKQIQTSKLRSGIYLLQIMNNETVINHRVVVR